MRRLILGLAAATSLTSVAPAATIIDQAEGKAGANAPLACSFADLTPSVGATKPTVLACSGFYDGNVLNNSSITQQFTGLQAVGFTWDKNFTALENAGLKYNLPDSKTVNLHAPVSGITYLGIHFGGGGPNGVGNGTAFYKIDAGNSLSNFLVKYQGISNIAIYSSNVAPPPPAVPEPAVWALLIGGFGMIGAAARRRNRPVLA